MTRSFSRVTSRYLEIVINRSTVSKPFDPPVLTLLSFSKRTSDVRFPEGCRQMQSRASPPNRKGSLSPL